MKNYKSLMAEVDSIIQQQNKKLPVSTSGLLAPKGKATPQQGMPSPVEEIAKYIAIIKKQREELIK